MGDLPFCQGGDFGFFLIILLALNLCYGNHVRVDDVQGFTESADCTPFGVAFSDASSATGLLLNMESKSTSGNLRRWVVAGEVDDDAGNFEMKSLQGKNLEDQAERGSCFMKLLNGDYSTAPCPGQSVRNVLAMVSKSLDNVKLEASTMIMETFPALAKKNFMSRKLLTLPDHSFEPVFPPIPVIQYPSPKLAPPRVISSPKLLPPPAPSPLPHTYNSLPYTAQAPEKSLPPPLAPYMNQPPPPYSQRLVPSTAPAPMVIEPHVSPLAPTYKNPAPAFPPVAHKKPTITSPPMHSPGPVIFQKPNPSPPVPTFKKKSAPPQPQPPSASHPPIPIQQPKAPISSPISSKPTTPAAPSSHPVKPDPQKPNTPPVPTPIPSPSQNSPVNPPAVSTVHNSAPSPLPIVNPTPPTPRQKQFYPIPKAPHIPQLPPVPTVPRRYFNFPQYGSQPSSPPS